MGPGGVFVVGGAGLEDAVEDADEFVGEFASGGLAGLRSGIVGVVVGPGAGRCAQGAEGPLVDGVIEAPVADVAGDPVRPEGARLLLVPSCTDTDAGATRVDITVPEGKLNPPRREADVPEGGTSAIGVPDLRS